MYTTMISSQGQTSVPVSVRRLLGLEEGNELIWQVVNQGKDVYARVMSPSLKTLRSLRGSARELYKKDGGGIKYLKKERQSWEKVSAD